MNPQSPTPRTQVKRAPQRGHYDRETIDRILDAGLICHVGFVAEGQPVVIPTAYGRVGDRLYIHGSPASRMLKSLQQDLDVCVTVTLLDGLVLARSAFHHSMNYRSVVIFGQAELVADPAAKEAALRAFTNQVLHCFRIDHPQQPTHSQSGDRWDELRPVTPQEIAGTTVLALPLTEASAKIRTGPPLDDAADYDLPIWAGVLPIQQTLGNPQADDRLPPHVPLPPSVQQLVTAYSLQGSN